MATMEKIGSKYRVRRVLGGKLKTVGMASTKADAVILRRRVEEEERAQGSVIYGSQLPMGELLLRWRLAKVGNGNDSEHTLHAEARLRSLCTDRAWHGTASITALEVSDYRRQGGSPRTCSFLAGVLRWARDTLDQYVDPKALVALRAGKAGRRPSPDLLADESICAAQAIADGMSESAGDLVHCLSTYGWRPITAAGMVGSDFNPFTGAVEGDVKGGDRVRHLLLPETLVRLRRRIASIGPSDPLFTDPRTGGQWNRRGGISRWARDHLRLKVYDLKRYAISSMLDRGIPPQHIAAFTGHRTVGQVLKYARSNEARQRAALALMGKHGKRLETATNQASPEAEPTA